MRFFLQVKVFDSVHYLKAFGVGDAWVAVGWSSDIIPAAKRMNGVAVIVPRSGASLWADLWVCSEFCLIKYSLSYLRFMRSLDSIFSSERKIR